MGKGMDKFVLLMWKNFLLQWRHPIQTIVEIVAPLLFITLLVVIRGLVYHEEHAVRLYTPFEAELPNRKITEIAWSPTNAALGEIMEDAIEVLRSEAEISKIVALLPFKDSKSLEAHLKDALEINNATWGSSYQLVGVQFDDSLGGNKKLTPHLNVTIRFPAELHGFYSFSNWKTDALFETFQTGNPREYYTNDGEYNSNGFVKIQQEVSYSIIKYFKKQIQKESFDRSSVPINIQKFPEAKWTEDIVLTIFQPLLGLMIMLSFMFTCISTIKVITTEKEKQLKETMKIMGLPNWLHWLAWFIKTFIILLITVTLMVILMTVKWYPQTDMTIFTNSNPMIIILFLLIFTFPTITLCFAVSVFFTKANTAAVIGGVLWFFSFYPFLLSQYSYTSTSLAQKLLGSLCSNSAMGYGFQLIMMFEGIQEGIQWHNIWKTANPDDDLVLGHLMIMLMIDALIYLLIALYVEAVFPGEYGVPQVWYFPFTPTYWCGKSRQVGYEGVHDEVVESEFYEREPTHLKVGVKIQNLRKTFSKKTVAVKNLSLNLFKDQITVLLGHNGAGKTTTMSMLTGMIPPTSGTAIVGGCDIRKDIAGVRDSLGLCPQHNILFNELTVKEHLYFYSKLKGLDKEQINEEINKFVELLELTDKGEARSVTLSGGMKRKLSVAIALCGGSSVVMCDEPSSGMDPSSRRALWDLLQSQKKGRTILLTTHFMDEADLLGDRIAIMADGELQCCGSSYFLKKKYGAGYRLIMDKSPECNINKITNLLQKYINNIQVESNIGSELTYMLSEEKVSVFQEMLSDLETQSSDLGVLNYGISLTNFDEVFMKVTTSHGREDVNNVSGVNENENNNSEDLNHHGNNRHSETKVNVDEQKYNFLTGGALFCNQVLAMFIKRFLSVLRSWYFFLALQNIIPIVFVIASFTVIRSFVSTLNDLPNLKIELDSYNDPVTVLTRYPNNKYAEKYSQILNEQKKTLIDWKDTDMTENYLQEAKADRSRVRMRYLAGATFWKNNTINAWFNNNPYHILPLTLQLVMNSILQKEISDEYSIQMYNHPLPFSQITRENEGKFSNNMNEFLISYILGFGMAFVSSFYIIFYIRERVSNAKHLQFVSGVGVIPFWLSAFLCDLLTYIITALCIIATFAAFQEDGFKTATELGRLFSILLYFGFSMLPLMYLASYLFKAPTSGFAKMTFLNILSGVMLFIIMYSVKPLLDDIGIGDVLHIIFLLIPLYSFCSGLRDVTRLYNTQVRCDVLVQDCINSLNKAYGLSEHCLQKTCNSMKECCLDYYDMQEPGIGKNVLISCIVGVVLILIVLLIDYRWFERICCKSGSQPPPEEYANTEQDIDVVEEKEKIRKVVNAREINKYNLVMHNVTKYYKKFLAVNNICLGVSKYECFGLLGVNGAGKTSTFKMMTGDVKFSYGDAWVNGMNLKSDMKKVNQVIGYCPQFDALLDDLTCRETIIIFSLLKGISMKESKTMAEKLSRDFDFYQHLHKKVKQLSGGNKRKLSTAIALIGDPQVLYLDEPTTGMDPLTKRYLWSALCKVRDSGKCIILTSHSMEECEALCTRLAIMVNGVFKCLGSTQHLKSRFSEGYTLAIRLKKTDDESHITDTEAIEKFVSENFQNAVVREKHQDLITFYIADRTQSWSKMFGIMENGRKSLRIEDYSLGQSSLEQVFLSFTKYPQIQITR